MVKQDSETIHHVWRDQIQYPSRHKSGSTPCQQQCEPPQGKAGHKGHTQKDEKERQSIAHIAGDHHVPTHQSQCVSRHQKGRMKGF